jgi:SsrA-binding protein
MNNSKNKKKSADNTAVVRNRKATFDYEILDTYTAGIVLTGTEVKSLREGKAGLTDTFCIFDKGELWAKNTYIAEYFYGSYNNHNSHRDRKLLLNRKELRALENDSKEVGMTIVPLKMFFTAKGLAKMEIALCRGKKQYDKRESIKEKDSKRELDRARRDYGKYK